MNTRKYSIISIVIFVFVVLIFALYRLHYREITTGSFFGLEIGDNKEKVYATLKEKENNIGPISPLSLVPGYLDDAELRYALTNYNYERINLSLKSEETSTQKLTSIFIDDGKVVKLYNTSVSLAQNIKMGDNIDKVISEIKRGKSNKSITEVWVGTKGYGAEMNQTQVLISKTPPSDDNDAYVWLMQQGSWSFKIRDKWQYYNLIFNSDKLHKIIYKNNFMELP